MPSAVQAQQVASKRREPSRRPACTVRRRPGTRRGGSQGPSRQGPASRRRPDRSQVPAQRRGRPAASLATPLVLGLVRSSTGFHVGFSKYLEKEAMKVFAGSLLYPDARITHELPRLRCPDRAASSSRLRLRAVPGVRPIPRGLPLHPAGGERTPPLGRGVFMDRQLPGVRLL